MGDHCGWPAFNKKSEYLVRFKQQTTWALFINKYASARFVKLRRAFN